MTDAEFDALKRELSDLRKQVERLERETAWVRNANNIPLVPALDLEPDDHPFGDVR
jgi:hypothetical protein